ncbi:MAG: stage II sporulation protein M, partial [Parcubacteria group bacterium]|nr:stage II sporulation protein M [Parcubacteria group bacterium]
SVIIAEKGMKLLLMGTIPHGVLEVPAFLIAAAIGLRLGRRYYRSLRYKDPFKPFFSRSMKEMFRIVVPLLIVASFIETFITSMILRSL